jgi:uncharacterized membrane protein
MINISARGLGIALIVSLAVNLFLAGVIVAAVALHGRGPFGERHYPPRWTAERSLHGESREKVVAIWRDARPTLRERIRAVRRARREIREQLSAPTLDRAALDAAFSVFRKRSDEAHAAMQDVFSKIAGTLDAEERRAYFRYPRRRHHD